MKLLRQHFVPIVWVVSSSLLVLEHPPRHQPRSCCLPCHSSMPPSHSSTRDCGTAGRSPVLYASMGYWQDCRSCSQQHVICESCACRAYPCCLCYNHMCLKLCGACPLLRDALAIHRVRLLHKLSYCRIKKHVDKLLLHGMEEGIEKGRGGRDTKYHIEWAFISVFILFFQI